LLNSGKVSNLVKNKFMKHRFLCFFVFCVAQLFSMKTGYARHDGSQLRFGFGAGAYWNSETGKNCADCQSDWPDTESLLVSMDYRIRYKWEIGMQAQIGSGWEGGKDVDIALFAVRSFFRHDNLRLGIGLGYGSRERSESIKNGDYTKITNTFTLPGKIELSLLHCRSVSLSMMTGMVFNSYMGKIGWSATYIAPVLRIKL
jgi:hypothetical protein